MDQSHRNFPKLSSQRESAVRLSSLAASLNMDKDNPYHEELVTEMLMLPDQMRNKQIREVLSDWLDQIQFFNQLRNRHGDQYVRKFYACLTAQRFRQGQIMIKTGDESTFFYVILKGAVMVLYPRSKGDVQEDNKMIDATQAKKVNLKERINRRFENHSHFKGVPVTSITNYDRYFNELGVPIVSVENILEKGRGFGQLGILYKSKRMADVVCQQDCVVAKISREKYLKLVGDQIQNKISDRLEFLSRHFGTHIGVMARNQAQRYLYLFEEVEWKVNSVIFTVGTPLKGLFLIAEGCVDLKTQQIQPVVDDTRSIERYGIFKSHKKKRLAAFKQLGVGESFGIQQFVKTGQQKGLKYNYQASTNTKSKILYCSLAKLLPILKADKQLQRQLKGNFQMKQELRPIQQVLSPEARLESYSSLSKTTRPHYRLMPLLTFESNVIRSPKCQSTHSPKSYVRASMVGVYKNSVMHTINNCDQKKKSLSSKVMSRALHLCAIEEIANNFRKKMKEWRRYKNATAASHKIYEEDIDKKNIERIAKHMRMI